MARLAVSVDSRGSLVAISSLSEGTYTHPEGYTSPMAGELFGERELVLTIPAITFRSESGTGFNNDASRFTVMAHGGSASGLALTFSR